MQHGALFYFVPWFVALSLMLVTLWGVKRIAWFQAPIHRTEDGRTRVTPRYYRLGGVIAAVIFLLMLWGNDRLEHHAPYVVLSVGTLVVIGFSIIDDLRHVRWPWHLAFQLLLGLLIVIGGMQLDLSHYLSAVLGNYPEAAMVIGVFFWIVLIMNAINWADGSDGLMPGMVGMACMILFFLALRPEVNQPTIAILAMILLGLSLGLAFFNWYPAHFLAGTGGAYFFGYTLAVLGLYAGMKVATLLLVLAVPVFDAVFVIIRRMIRGRSPFLPDAEHFHHLLLAHGWSAKRIATTYLLVTGTLGVLALSFQGEQKVLIFLCVGLLLFTLTLSLLWKNKQSGDAQITL